MCDFVVYIFRRITTITDTFYRNSKSDVFSIKFLGTATLIIFDSINLMGIGVYFLVTLQFMSSAVEFYEAYVWLVKNWGNGTITQIGPVSTLNELPPCFRWNQ